MEAEYHLRDEPQVSLRFSYRCPRTSNIRQGDLEHNPHSERNIAEHMGCQGSYPVSIVYLDPVVRRSFLLASTQEYIHALLHRCAPRGPLFAVLQAARRHSQPSQHLDHLLRSPPHLGLSMIPLAGFRSAFKAQRLVLPVHHPHLPRYQDWVHARTPRRHHHSPPPSRVV